MYQGSMKSVGSNKISRNRDKESLSDHSSGGHLTGDNKYLFLLHYDNQASKILGIPNHVCVYIQFSMSFARIVVVVETHSCLSSICEQAYINVEGRLLLFGPQEALLPASIHLCSSLSKMTVGLAM